MEPSLTLYPFNGPYTAILSQTGLPLSFFEPIIPVVSSGIYYFTGSVGLQSVQLPANITPASGVVISPQASFPSQNFYGNTLLVMENNTNTSNPILVPPLYFLQIYQTANFSLWSAVAPPGYVSIGLVATAAGAGYVSTNAQNNYRCVSAYYTALIPAVDGGLQPFCTLPTIANTTSGGNLSPNAYNFPLSLYSLPYSNCLVPGYGPISPGQNGSPALGSLPAGPVYDLKLYQQLNPSIG